MPLKIRLSKLRVKQVLDLAREVYKTSNIDPTAGAYFSEGEVEGRHCACAIGAAVYGALKEIDEKEFKRFRRKNSEQRDKMLRSTVSGAEDGQDWDAVVLHKFNRIKPVEISAIIDGFDRGYSGDKSRCTVSNPEYKQAYELAYEFGQAMLKEMEEAK